MTEILEDTNFDYIILGTGLIESILAGSLARSGKKVLHLDSHQNYGGNWSVFGFRELISWYLNINKESANSSKEGDLSIDYEHNYTSNFRNIKIKLADHIEDSAVDKPISKSDQALFDAFFKDTVENTNEMKLFNQLINKSRSYNLDTTPKLLSTREELVEILIRSGVGRYLEFKNVDDIYIYNKSTQLLEKVPSSKEDVFTNKTVTLIEKRKLMKFLTFAMEYNKEDPILEGTENMNYDEFLKEKFKISGQLQDAIIYAIALVDKNVSVEEGLKKTHKFVSSMGRFGKGAYLCPLYGGASEIAQAFCRVCAVYGGVYILNQPLDKYVVQEDSTSVVTDEGVEYKCKKLITGLDYLNSSWLPDQENFSTWISRAIIVSSFNLSSEDLKGYASDCLSYAIFPPGSDAGNMDGPIYGIYQNDESMACPKGEYVTYLWTTSKDETVLEKAVEYISKKKSGGENEARENRVIMSVFYQQRSRSAKDYETTWKNLPKNIIPCSDPDVAMNFESAISEAHSLFYKCEAEDVEFMPAAEQEQDDDDN